MHVLLDWTVGERRLELGIAEMALWMAMRSGCRGEAGFGGGWWLVGSPRFWELQLGSGSLWNG